MIAHSRGACDALAFALDHPGFVRDRVEALFLIQGPFGGSALADYLGGDGAELDPRMPARLRVLARVIAGVERRFVRKGRHGGMVGLTRSESRAFWSKRLADRAGAVPIVGPRTFFLASACPPDGHGLFRRITGLYLSFCVGPNDGLVAVEDQSLPGFGTNLGVLECGHGDLTGRSRLRSSARHLPRALTESLLMILGPADEDPSPARVGRRWRSGRKP